MSKNVLEFLPKSIDREGQRESRTRTRQGLEAKPCSDKRHNG